MRALGIQPLSQKVCRGMEVCRWQRYGGSHRGHRGMQKEHEGVMIGSPATIDLVGDNRQF